MDPVSAIGVAASAITFFDFALETFGLYKKLCEKGSLPEHRDLANRAKTLSSMTQKFAITSTITNDKRISEIGLKCTAISDSLQALLKSVEPTKSTLRQRSKALLRTMRQKRTIEKLENDLSAEQKLLDTAYLISIKQRAEALGLLSKDLVPSMQIIESRIAKISNLISTEHAQTRTHLSSAVQQEHLKTRFENQVEHANTQEHMSSIVKQEFSKGFKETKDILVTADVKTKVLKSLFFEEYNSRREEIEEAHRETFRWIFDDVKDGRWDSFSKWLRGDEETIYWIQGKAGSGKSTLMAFILEEAETQHHLREWAGENKLLCLSFFFWRAGTDKQKRTLGLLLSLAYQIIKADPILVTQLEIDLSNIPIWTEKTLRPTLSKLFKTSTSNICIFIDGLDEFEGDDSRLEALLDLCSQWPSLPNVKLCVSSRPELLLKQSLQGHQTLCLQDLTHEDMVRYCGAQLSDRVVHSKEFAEKIVRRAEGVFLWTSLVTKSLLKGARSHDDEALMARRLETYPRGMNQLYEHILQRIDPFHEERARNYLQMTLLTSSLKDIAFQLTLFGLAAAYNDKIEQICEKKGVEPFNPEVVTDSCSKTEDQVSIYCMGFLEVAYLVDSTSDSDDDSDNEDAKSEQQYWRYRSARVKFAHRTGQDFFLETRAGSDFISGDCLSNENLVSTFLNGKIREFQVLLHTCDSNELASAIKIAIDAAIIMQKANFSPAKLIGILHLELSLLDRREAWVGKLIEDSITEGIDLSPLGLTDIRKNFQVIFWAFCGTRSKWELSSYIYEDMQGRSTGFSCRAIAFLLKTRLQWRYQGHYLGTHLYLTRHLLDYLARHLPSTAIKASKEYSHSKSQWLELQYHQNPFPYISKQIDYSVAAKDPAIGSEAAAVLSILSDTSALLAATLTRILSFVASENQPEIHGNLFGILRQLQGLVPDGYIWCKMLEVNHSREQNFSFWIPPSHLTTLCIQENSNSDAATRLGIHADCYIMLFEMNSFEKSRLSITRRLQRKLLLEMENDSLVVVNKALGNQKDFQGSFVKRSDESSSNVEQLPFLADGVPNLLTIEQSKRIDRLLPEILRYSKGPDIGRDCRAFLIAIHLMKDILCAVSDNPRLASHVQQILSVWEQVPMENSLVDEFADILIYLNTNFLDVTS